MRILYVSQYYPPDIGAPSARVSELAQAWARAGHEVTVLTAFSHHPHGTKQPQDRRKFWRWERDGEVQVLRAYVYAAPNAGFLWRIVSYVSFMFSALLCGSMLTRSQDVVIATSPQLFTGVAGRWLALVKRARFLFEVRDLWPESIVGVGAMKPSRAIRWLEYLAHWLYRSCDRIITVGAGYKKLIVEKYAIDPAKFEVIPNGVDVTRFQLKATTRANVRRSLDIQDETVILYLGTHGMAHGLELVLDVAERLQYATSLRFLFVGDGAERQQLIDDAERRKLRNVQFLGPQPRDKVIGFYAAADICLVPLRKVALFQHVLPSKMFEILAMGRPMILSVEGDARDLLDASGGGIGIPPEDSSALEEAIVQLAQSADLRSDMGRRGSDFVRTHYDRQVLAARYLRILERTVQPPRARGFALPRLRRIST